MKQVKKQKKEICDKVKKLICLQNINCIKMLKQKIQNLPTNHNYQSSQEINYLRVVTQILEIIPKIKLEQIEYVIDEQQLRKVFVQLNQQPQNKQIILSLLKYLLRGIQIYTSLVNGELYQIIDFLIQIDDLYITKPNQNDSQLRSSQMRKYVLSLSLYALIQHILKWYCLGNQPCNIRDKYSKLAMKMKKYNK